MSIQRLDLSFDDPAENLALDEALLEALESDGVPETLRFWQFQQTVVVLGRASQHAVEVNVEACRRDSIPILRRSSGGAAILAGPGCLLYSAVLNLDLRPELRSLSQLHAWMMHRVSTALQQIGVAASWQGTCDVTVADRKVSGNSVRLCRRTALYHGTVLCHMPIDRIAEYLRTAPRQPDYRKQRDHDQFLTQTDCDPDRLADQLALIFEATRTTAAYPIARMKLLAESRYRRDDWTYRH